MISVDGKCASIKQLIYWDFGESDREPHEMRPSKVNDVSPNDTLDDDDYLYGYVVDLETVEMKLIRRAANYNGFEINPINNPDLVSEEYKKKES